MFPPPSRCLSLEEASLGEGRITHERTEQETKIVFEPLWRSVFQNYFILKSHLFVQDKHYELCSFKNLLIRSNGFNRLLMDAS